MLRSLELFGFKSFADKTVFEFSAGITGVVGPNGSGKSNVVDSIKWILGDQSAKSLRGKDMTDVIFNGASGRGGAQFAEATLVFDNKSRFLPLDMDEVSVGRRLWQSGDSEYLVNRNTARLKDVRELFMGTGAGATAYCIIEQGRVDQILQSNAANRRLIFEEAAGISRFKSRRTEALKRLERVEQNLVRLTDIVDEVESQVNSIRSQAQRAARYREVSTELEQLWVGMAADEYRRESVRRDQLQAEISLSGETVEGLRAEQAAAEKQLQAVDESLSTVDDELREVETVRSELRSRLASLQTTIRHQVARETELLSDLQRLHRQSALMDNRLSEAVAEEQHLSKVLLLEREAIESRRHSLQKGDAQSRIIDEAVAKLQEIIESTRAQVLQQAQRNSQTAADVGAHRSRLESAQKRNAELAQQEQRIQAQLSQLHGSLDDFAGAVESMQQDLTSAQNIADEILRSRNDLIEEQTMSRQSLSELRENRSAMLARRSVLEDLEDRQEGFGIGVREILRRAEEADAEPWDQICGSVADLLDVDMDNAALLEVALSGRAQLLVVRKLKPLLDYLNTGRCRINGRVGFVSLEQAQTAAADDESMKQPAAELRPDDLSLPTVVVPADDDFSSSWWSSPPMSSADDMTLSSGLDDPLALPGSTTFPVGLEVTWVDPRTDSPVVRSVFMQDEAQPPVLFGRPGIIGRADGLARSPRQLPRLAACLLADTWIVGTLEDAVRLHAECSGRYRFVTLQGELIEADGTLYAGTLRNESAVLSRKSEMRRLRNELTRLEHEIANRELIINSLGGDIQNADAELESAHRAVQDAAGRVRQADARLTEQRRLLAEATEKARLNAEQKLQFEQELNQLQNHIDEADGLHLAGEQRLQQLQQHLSENERSQAQQQRDQDVLERERTTANMELTRSEERLAGLTEAIDRIRDDIQQRHLQQQEAERRLKSATEKRRDTRIDRLNATGESAELHVQEEQLTYEIQRRSEARNVLRQQRNEATRQEAQIRSIFRQHESRHHELELQIRSIDHQLQTSAERIRDEFQIEIPEAVASGRSAIAVWLHREKSGNRRTDDNQSNDNQSNDEDLPRSADAEDDAGQEHSGMSGRQRVSHGNEVILLDEAAQAVIEHDQHFAEAKIEIDRRIERLRRQLKKIGNVSTESLDNLAELETRFERLHSQLTDLEAARDTLRDIVRKINVESRRMFLETFECIRGHFRELFRRLFGGGEADLILEDPEDVLECAIEVVARPPGKELRSLSLLSGGEKTMTAVGLLLSIFRSRPSPFCILDEVDAALDDANIGRFVNVLRDFQQSTQFIMITHRKPTMAVTDVLYGVTMEESGVSRRLSLRFEDVDETGHFNPQKESSTRAA